MLDYSMPRAKLCQARREPYEEEKISQLRKIFLKVRTRVPVNIATLDPRDAGALNELDEAAPWTERLTPAEQNMQNGRVRAQPDQTRSRKIDRSLSNSAPLMWVTALRYAK